MSSTSARDPGADDTSLLSLCRTESSLSGFSLHSFSHSSQPNLLEEEEWNNGIGHTLPLVPEVDAETETTTENLTGVDAHAASANHSVYLPPPPPSLTSPSLPTTPATSDMFLDGSPEHVEIVLPSDTVIMRGVGQNVEPALLSGTVVLTLQEPTNIREIVLSFTGKARLPQPEGRQTHFRQQIATHTVFSREWSFLEGGKSHRRTLKAGQHVFPFQLSIDESFPTSVGTPSANIVYKLRATVIRSSFSSNWATQRFITILKGFSPEALEYTQTIEIENTWPGKIMYSIMIPHKAFAAGDEIPALLKFTPLVKGTIVQSIEGVVKQTTSIRWKNSVPIEDTKTVARGMFLVEDGQAIDEATHSQATARLFQETASSGAALVSGLSGTHLSTSPPTSPRPLTSQSPPLPSSPESLPPAVELGDGEVETWVKLPIWKYSVPTNEGDPVSVHHKLKWSIMLSNADGHVSELRASLPIHILSHALLDEALSPSSQTRALLTGVPNPTDPSASSLNLPSYASHVHDRVANALDGLRDAILTANPLRNLNAVASGSGSRVASASSSPRGAHSTLHGHHNGYFGLGGTRSTQSSHPATPALFGHPGSILDPSALEYVDSGLLLSLGVSERGVGSSSTNFLSRTSSRTDTPPDSRRSSMRPFGGFGHSSASSSRATSPEVGTVDLPSTSATSNTSHGRHAFSLSGSLKPFTPFGSSKSSHPITPAPPSVTPPSPRSHPRHQLPTASSSQNLRSDYSMSSSRPSSSQSTSPLAAMTALLSRVPDYERASQGFLGGGVTPLDANAGLPTYDEVERVERVARVRSDGALADMVRRQPVVRWREDTEARAQEVAQQSGSTTNPTAARRRSVAFTLEE